MSPEPSETTTEVLVAEGWWNPNVLSGRVHDHTDRQPMTMHRPCEQVYTKRSIRTSP